MNQWLKNYIPILLLSALFSSIVLMCSVPPVSRDALTHHLAVPKLYVTMGSIHELPEIKPSYYPQLLDLIYCLPLMLGNDIAPKYIHFTFAILTAVLIFLYLQQNLDRFFGLLGVLFFLSLPVIVKLSVTVYVDLGLIFFSTASLICLLKWHEKQFSLRWLILSAVCCGLALSTKYNGLITFFLLTFFTPIIFLRGQKNNQASQLKTVKYAAVFLFISILIFSPWMIKNYVWTQNPVYPLYNNYFSPETVSENRPEEPYMNHFLIRKIIYKESWLETATIPLRIFFQGKDDDPKLFDGKLNPLLLLLPLFAFISPKKYPGEDFFQKKVLLLFSILYILIVFFQQDMRIRWIGPAIPPLVILSAHGLKNLFQYFTPDKKTVSKKDFFLSQSKNSLLFVLVLSMAALNAVYIYQLFTKITPLDYISQKVTRSAYIERFRPEYAALQFANHDLKAGTKLLAFFLGNRRYYSDHDISFNDAAFKHLVQTSETADEIFNGLKTEKYSHLIINYPKFNSWVRTNFNTEEMKRIQEFINQYTKRLFLKNNHGLYQLTSDKEDLSRR